MATADGSVVIDVDMDASEAEKKLSVLKAAVKDLEKRLAEGQKKETAAAKEEEKAYRNLEKAQQDLAKAQEKRDSLVEQQGPLIAQLNQVRGKWEEAKKAVSEYSEQVKNNVAGSGKNLADAEKYADDLKRQYFSILSQIEKMDPAILKENATVDEQEEKVQQLSDSYTSAQQKTAEIARENENLSNELEQARDDAGALAKEINEIEEARIQAIADSAKVADEHIVELNEELAELKERQKELEVGGIGLGYQEYDENTARIAEITKELKEYQKSLSDVETQADRMAQADSAVGSALGSFRQNLSAISDQLKPLADGIFSALTKAATALKSFGKVAVKAFSLAADGFAKLLDKVNIFPKLFGSIGKALKRFGQMVRRVFVFSVITSGLRAVRTQMSKYLSMNAQFTTALRQLKGVLLTAFQPIYNVVVPALVTLLNVLSRVIAAITQFTAVLFGTTAKQAQKNAKALYEQANATSAAGGAAEEASLQLAAFDEINKLEGEKGGGGGGGAVDTGPLFDWEYDDTPFPDWGEAFSAFLDKILDNIPKLREEFKNFADWLNDFSKKLYDMFTFPGVLDKVKQIGVELAQAFNDLVNWIDWYQLGQALGAGLNLALNFLTSFLYTFDWMNLGRKLAEFINGLVSEIDWYEFGRLLWTGFKIALETLAGFIVGLDMPQLAEAANNIIRGFFTEMINTIDRIQWNQIGLQIASFINKIDWVGDLALIATAIAKGINAAVQTLGTLISTIDWATIGYAVANALNKLIADIDWAALGKTFSDGINNMLTLALTFLETADWYMYGEKIATMLENIDWVGAFSKLAKIIGDAVWAVLQLALGLIENHVPEILLIISAIVAAIGIGIPGIIAGLGPIITGAIVALAAVVFAKWEEIKAYFIEKIEEAGGNIVLGLLKGIADGLVGIAMWLKEHLVDPIVNGVKSLFGIQSPSTVFAEIGRFLIEGLFNGISETWSIITEFFGEKVEALKQNLLEAWENIKQTASEKWVEIKENLGQKWDEIRESARLKFEEIKNKILDAWAKAKEETFKKWEEIKTTLATTWENIKTAASEKFNSIKNSIIEIMGKLKDHDWKGIGTTIMNGIWNGLKSVWDNISSWARNAASTLGNIFTSAKNNISSIKSSAGTSRIAIQSMPDISAYDVPALARGAVIPPNREFLAVLGDQKYGTNVEAPADLIRQMVMEGIRAAGGGISNGNRDISITLELDGQTFAHAVYKANNDETQRVGVRLAEVRG